MEAERVFHEAKPRVAANRNGFMAGAIRRHYPVGEIEVSEQVPYFLRSVCASKQNVRARVLASESGRN